MHERTCSQERGESTHNALRDIHSPILFLHGLLIHPSPAIVEILANLSTTRFFLSPSPDPLVSVYPLSFLRSARNVHLATHTWVHVRVRIPGHMCAFWNTGCMYRLHFSLLSLSLCLSLHVFIYTRSYIYSDTSSRENSDAVIPNRTWLRVLGTSSSCAKNSNPLIQLSWHSVTFLFSAHLLNLRYCDCVLSGNRREPPISNGMILIITGGALLWRCFK